MIGLTLAEIIEAARSGERPGYDDLRYAVCAMDLLMTFDRLALDRLAEAEREGKKAFLTRSAVWQQAERHGRIGRALDKAPLDFLGDNWNPDNPQVRADRKRAAALIERLVENARNGHQRAALRDQGREFVVERFDDEKGWLPIPGCSYPYEEQAREELLRREQSLQQRDMQIVEVYVKEESVSKEVRVLVAVGLPGEPAPFTPQGVAQ